MAHSKRQLGFVARGTAFAAGLDVGQHFASNRVGAIADGCGRVSAGRGSVVREVEEGCHRFLKSGVPMVAIRGIVGYAR
jgi:hypothetical protein